MDVRQKDAMTKRDKAERAALRQRMLDMLRGRVGNILHLDSILPGADEECAWVINEIGLEEWFDWIRVLKGAFCGSNGRNPEYGRCCPIYFELHNLHRFGQSLEESVAYLYEFGARADAEEIES